MLTQPASPPPFPRLRWSPIGFRPLASRPVQEQRQPEAALA